MEIEGVEEWEVEKILNKKKIKKSREVPGMMERVYRGRGVRWERKENLEE